MNFKEAILETFERKTKLSGNTKKAAERARKEKHPRLWKALENVVAHRYERATGETVTAGFDWSTALDWLLENLPKIISLIIALFGA